MKKLFHILILLSLFTLSCSEDNPVESQIDDGITWEQITGKLAYLKGNVLYIIDADTGSVKSLGSTNLTNLKWNKTLNQISDDWQIRQIESYEEIGSEHFDKYS